MRCEVSVCKLVPEAITAGRVKSQRRPDIDEKPTRSQVTVITNYRRGWKLFYNSESCEVLID